jgi:hypothetical protein
MGIGHEELDFCSEECLVAWMTATEEPACVPAEPDPTWDDLLKLSPLEFPWRRESGARIYHFYRKREESANCGWRWQREESKTKYPLMDACSACLRVFRTQETTSDVLPGER